MTARTVDLAIAALAALQFGAFSRAQALTRGATDQLIQRRLAARAWARVAPGVYRLPSHPPSWEQRLSVASLAMDAVVSYQAAAALHGLATFGPAPVTVTVPHGGSRRPALAVVHQSSRLLPDHVTTVRGLPVTTVERTLVDLAGVCRRARLEQVVDDAVAARRTTVQRLCDCFDDLARPGRTGGALLRTVLADRQPGYVPPASALEARLLRVLKEGGLPRPVLQFRHPGRLPVDGRVDCAYPDHRLLIEVDSRRWHSRWGDQVADRRRDAEALAAGYRTLRFSHDDLGRRPAWVCDMVARARASPAA